MSSFLPFVMQNLCNRPLMVSEAHGRMIASALAGRLNLSSFEDSYTRLDAAEMARIAEGGRADADARRAALATKPYMTAQQAGPARGKSFEQAGEIAVIRVWGTLTRNWGVGPYSGSTGYDGIQIQLLDAIQDRDVKAIWLDINSGGGAVDGCFDLVDLIWSMNEKNGGKPIYAMAADYAFSAAYALATAADKVYVPATGGVGSVGVIMLHADITQMLENEGVKVTLIRSGERKYRGSEFEALDADTLDHLQGQCDEIRSVFIDRVARNMGISKKVVSDTEALDYMGAAAKTIGFVTDVMPEHAAWAKLERKIARNGR